VVAFAFAPGTQLDALSRMAEKDDVTVEMSLEMLSEAVGKAAEDLRAVRVNLDQARTDIASRNSSISRQVVTDAERAIDNLRQTDESLQTVLKDLAERD
jgi:ABC-type transporter Mla subunit MlaD